MKQRKYQAQEDYTWQAVYMDLVTMLMIFFLLLWVLYQGKPSEGIGSYQSVMVEAGDSFFVKGKADLSQKAKDTIKKLSNVELGLGSIGKTRNRNTLVLHGHTDSDGSKFANLNLGYRRAYNVLVELSKYKPEVLENASICTHADNLKKFKLPYMGDLGASAEMRDILSRQTIDSNAGNRRVEIEYKTIIDGSRVHPEYE